MLFQLQQIYFLPCLSFPCKWESSSSLLSFPSLRKRGKRESSISINNIDFCFL
jgi:hypothetical protein